MRQLQIEIDPEAEIGNGRIMALNQSDQQICEAALRRILNYEHCRAASFFKKILMFAVRYGLVPNCIIRRIFNLFPILKKA